MQLYVVSFFLSSSDSEKEYDLMVDGLIRVSDEWATNSFKLLPGDEDIHSANERRLKVRYCFSFH